MFHVMWVKSKEFSKKSKSQHHSSCPQGKELASKSELYALIQRTDYIQPHIKVEVNTVSFYY
jgi:hypothetical protein